jgi:hypothetical protein
MRPRLVPQVFNLLYRRLAVGRVGQGASLRVRFCLNLGTYSLTP